MIYGDNKSGRGGTENVKPLAWCFCKSIKENLKLGINRQSIEKWEAVSFADTVQLFRLNPWLLELDSGTCAHQDSWKPVGFDYRTSTGLGKQTPGGHKQKLVRTRTQDKEAVIPQKADPDLPVSVQESPMEVWVSSGLVQGHGTWVQQCLHRTFWRRSPLSSLPPP